METNTESVDPPGHSWTGKCIFGDSTQSDEAFEIKVVTTESREDKQPSPFNWDTDVTELRAFIYTKSIKKPFNLLIMTQQSEVFSVEIKDDVKKEEFFNKLPRKMAILRPDPQKYSAIMVLRREDPPSLVGFLIDTPTKQNLPIITNLMKDHGLEPDTPWRKVFEYGLERNLTMKRIKEERELKGFCKKEPDAATIQESASNKTIPSTSIDLETADNSNKQTSSVDFLHNVSENISTNEKEDVVKDSEATPEALNDENQTTQNIIEETSVLPYSSIKSVEPTTCLTETQNSKSTQESSNLQSISTENVQEESSDTLQNAESNSDITAITSESSINAAESLADHSDTSKDAQKDNFINFESSLNVAESDTSKDAQQDNFNNIECNRDDIENNVTNDNVITSAEASSENIGNSSNTSCGNLPQDLQTTDSYMGNDSSALRKEFEEFSRSSFQSHTLFDDIDNVLKDSDDLLNQSLEKSSNEKDTHIEDQPLDKSANENCSGNLNDEENERVVTPDLSVPVDIMPPPSVQIIKEKAAPPQKRKHGGSNEDVTPFIGGGNLVAKTESPPVTVAEMEDYPAPPSVQMVGDYAPPPSVMMVGEYDREGAVSPPSNPLNVVQNSDGVLVPSTNNLDPSIESLRQLTDGLSSIGNNVAASQAQFQRSYNQAQTVTHQAQSNAIPRQQNYTAEEQRQWVLQQRQSYQAKQIAAQQSQVQHGDQNIQQRQAFHAQYQHQLQGPQQYPVPLGQQQGAQNFPNAQMNSGHYGHIQQDVGQQVMQNRPLNAMAGHHPTVHNRTANVHSAMNDHQYSQQHLNPQFVHQQQQRQVQHQANQNYPAQQQQILQHRHVQHPQGQQPQVQHHINQQPTNIQQVQQHYPYQQHANVQQMQQYRLMRPKVATQRPMLPNAMVSPQTNAPMNPQIRPQMPPGTMLPPRNNGPMNTYNSANLRHSQMQFPGQQNNIATGGRNLMQVEYANRIRHGHTHSNVQAQKSIPQQQIALNNHNSALQNHQVPAQHIAQSAQQIAQSNQLQTGNYHQQHLNAASQQLVNQPQVVSVANQNQLFARPNEVVSSHQQNFQGVTNVPQNLGHQPQQQPHVRQLYPRQQALINQHNQVAHQELVQHQPLNSHQNQQQVPSHQQQQNLRLLLQRPPQNISYQQSQQQQQYAQSQVQQQSHLAHSQFQQQNQIVHPQHSVPSIQQAQQPQQLAHQQNQQQSNPHWATQQEHMQQQNQQPKIPQDFLLPPYSQAVAGRSTSSAGNISSHVQPTITSAHSSTTNQITTERSTTCKKLENIYTEGSLTNVLLENRSKTVEILMPMIEELHMYEMSDEEVLRQTQFAIAVLQTWFKEFSEEKRKLVSDLFLSYMSGKIGCKKFFGDFKKQISFAYSVFHLKIAIKRKLTSLDSIHPCFKGIDIKFSKFPSYIDVEPAYQPFLTYLTEMYDEDNKKSFYRGVFLLCSWSFNLEDFLKYIEVIDAYNHVIEQAFFKFAKALSTQKDGYSKVVAYLNQFKEVPQKESLQSPESCHDANAYDNDSKSEEDKTESSPSLKAKINNSENLLVQDASSSRDTSETGLRSIETPSPPTVSHDSNLSPIDPLDQQGDNNASFEEESNSMPNLSVSPIPLDQQGDINASFEKESNSMPKPANESTSNVDFSIEVLRDPSTNELNITPPIDKVVENEFYNQNICKNYDENETSSENNTNARDDHTTSPTVKVPKMNIKPANAKYNSRSDPRLSAVPLTNSPKKPTSQPHKIAEKEDKQRQDVAFIMRQINNYTMKKDNLNEEQKIEFLLDLVSCINNEITTQQLIQKHPNWNVTNYSLSTKLPSLLWALFDKEAYITPKKISKELSYYIVDSVNRKLLPPKEKYQPTGKNVPTASVKNPPKFTNPPTNQNPPNVSPQFNLLGEKTHEVIFVFQLKICLNSTVYFVTCIELKIGLFFVQGLKEIINNSKVTVQMSTSNKNKLKFVARNSKGFSAMEETSFKQAFNFDVFKDDFFKSPGGSNIFTLTPSFVNFTKRFKTEINAALKMNFITPSPETIRFQWNDIIPAFDTDIVDNCIKTDKHVVLVLQSRLVFVSLDNPQNAEIFTNLGYGEKIGIKIQTTLTKISCSFSFDNFTTGYELVSMFVGMQRRLQCFTVDRDLLFVESDKHMISAWQGNTKSLRFMHRRIKCVATARIDLGNAIVPVQIIYFQQQHSPRNVQVFKINAVHKNLKRDIGLVSDVNDMNYLESHAGDVIDKDVKFVYSPSNREESFKLILSDEKFIYLSCYPVFKTTVLKYCNVLTSLVDFDKGNPLRTWKPMAGDCPIQHKQLNIPEDLPDELLARCAESAADAGNSSSTGNRTPGSSSNMSSPALSPRKRISDSSLSPGGLSPTKKVYSHQFPKKRKREVTSQLLPQQVKRLKSMPPSPSKRVLEEGEVEKTLSDISDAELETGGTGSLTPAVSLDNVSDTSFEGRSLSLVDKPVNDPLLELLEDVTNDTSTNENNTNENDLETSHDTSIFDIETVTDKTDNGSKDTLQTADFAEKEDDSKDNSTEKTDNGSKDTLQTADFAEKKDDSKDNSDKFEINREPSIPTNDDDTSKESNTNLLEVDKENIVNEKSLGESEECSNENLLKSAKLKPCRITLTPLPASACKNSDTDSSSDEASDKQSNEPSKNRNQNRPKPFETQKSHDSYFNDKRKELPKTLQSQKSHEPNIGKENKGHQSNSGSSKQKRPSFHRQQSKTLPSKPVIQTQKSIDIKSQSKAPTDYLSHILNTSNINQPIKPGEKGVSNELSKNRNNPLTNTSKKSTSSTKKTSNNDNTKKDKDLENICGNPNKNPPSCLDNEEMIDLAYDDIERLQDIPGVNEEQAQKIIDYRERKSIKDFFDFSTRLFFLKLFVNIIQFDVGALRRGNLILAFNGKRLDTTSMDETLRCFKLAAPDIENIAVPQIIVIAGCTSNSDIKDEFRRARRKTGVKWVQLVEQWIKQSGVDKSEFFKMKSEIKKNKSKEKNRRSSRTEESLIPRTSSPDRNSRDRAPADKNDKKKEEGLDAISDFINSTEPLPKEDNESNKENLQKSSNQKDNTKKSTNKNDENEKFSKDNSNDKVSADLRDYIGEDAPVINLNNRITLERKTESSDSSESENDDLNEDTTEKVNELVEKKGRATPNSVILSMTSTKSSSYNRLESVPENVQEESNSCSLKIRLKIPQNVRPERKRKRSGRSSLRKRNSSGQTEEASDRESVESNVQRHTRAASKRLRTVSTSDHSPTTPREDTPDNNTSTQDIPDVPLQENADSDHLTDNNTENNNEEAPAQTSSQKSDDDIRSISLEEKCKLWLKDSATFFSRPSQCRYSVKIQLSRILLEGSSGNQNSKTERQNTWSLEPITEEQENVDSDDCWFHFPDKKDAERYVGPVFSPLNWNYCSLCNKEYTDMSKHVQLVHSTETGAKNEEQRRHLKGTEKRRENGAPTPSQHVYICKKCELNFRTLDKLNSHIIKKH